MELENNKVMFTSRYHWSNAVIIITCIGLALILGAITYLVLIPANNIWLNFIIVALLGIAVLWGIAVTPISLFWNGENLVLKQLICRKVIPHKQIVNISKPDENALNGSIRTFGSGGLFGYLGKFYNKTIGNYSLYITEKKNLIIVKTTKRTYIFNCKNADELIVKINNKNATH